MGHQRFCVRMVTIVRTFPERTGQPAAPAISRSGFLRALHSIRSNEPWQCSLGTLRQPPFLSGKKTTSLFNKKTTERFPGPFSPCRTSIQPPAAARANISMGTEQLLAFRLTAHASRPLSLASRSQAHLSSRLPQICMDSRHGHYLPSEPPSPEQLSATIVSGAPARPWIQSTATSAEEGTPKCSLLWGLIAGPRLPRLAVKLSLMPCLPMRTLRRGTGEGTPQCCFLKGRTAGPQLFRLTGKLSLMSC